MAETYNLASADGIGAFPYGHNGTVRLDREIDFVNQPLTAGNHAVMFKVPAGCFARVAWEVLRADTGASTRTFDIGDAAVVDGYADGVDAKTTGKGCGASTVVITPPATLAGTNVAFALGKYYAAAGEIRLQAVENLATGKVRVSLLIQNVNAG